MAELKGWPVTGLGRELRYRPFPVRGYQKRMIRSVLELPDQLRELLRPAQNDGLQVAPNLSCQCEQHVRVFAQIGRQPDDRCLRRRRHKTALDLAQVGRFDGCQGGARR